MTLTQRGLEAAAWTRLEDALARFDEHRPYTPRQRDAAGNPVDEPVQCMKCLYFWPCDVKLLADEVRRLRTIEPENDPETWEFVSPSTELPPLEEEPSDEAHDDPPAGR